MCRRLRRAIIAAFAAVIFSATSFSLLRPEPVLALGVCDFLSGDAKALCRAAEQSLKKEKQVRSGTTGEPDQGSGSLPNSRKKGFAAKPSSGKDYLSNEAVLRNPLERVPSQAIPYTSREDSELADKSASAYEAGNFADAYRFANASCSKGTARACFLKLDSLKLAM